MTGGIGQNPNLYNYQAFLNKKQTGFKGDFQSPVSPEVTQQAGQVADQARQQAQQGAIGHAATKVAENKDNPNTMLLSMGAGVLGCSALKKLVDPFLFKLNGSGYQDTFLYEKVKKSADKLGGKMPPWEKTFRGLQLNGLKLIRKIPFDIRKNLLKGWNIYSPAVESGIQPSVEGNARKVLLESLKSLTPEQLNNLPEVLKKSGISKLLETIEFDGNTLSDKAFKEIKRAKYNNIFGEAFKHLNDKNVLSIITNALDNNLVAKKPEGLGKIASALWKPINNVFELTEKTSKNLTISLNMRNLNKLKLPLLQKAASKVLFWARNNFANNPLMAGAFIGMSLNSAINAKEKKFSTFVSEFCQMYIGFYLISGPIGKLFNAVGGLRGLPDGKGKNAIYKVTAPVLRNIGKLFSWGQGKSYGNLAPSTKNIFLKPLVWLKNGGKLPIKFPHQWSIAGLSRLMIVQSIAGAIIGATLLKVVHGIFGKPPEEDKEKDKASEKKTDNTNSVTTQKPAAAPGMPEAPKKPEQLAKPEAPAMPSASKSSVTSSNSLIQELINKKKNAPKEENNLASQPIGAKKLDKKEAAPEEEVYLPSATAPKYLEKAQAEQQKKVQVSNDLLTKSNDLLAKTDRILKGDFKDM